MLPYRGEKVQRQRWLIGGAVIALLSHGAVRPAAGRQSGPVKFRPAVSLSRANSLHQRRGGARKPRPTCAMIRL